jgi:hypothetical protein
MARPAFIPSGTEGREHIEKRDITIPRIQIAQAQSPQALDGDPKYIDGLRAGDVWNSLTKENLGRGPIKFSIVQGVPPTWLEFNPREIGGVKEFNIPESDPRTKSVNGERPVATMMYNYIILMHPLSMEAPMSGMVMMSCKGSNLKHMRDLNTFIQMRNTPIWTGVYELRTVLEKNSLGTFYAYDFVNAGWPESEDQMKAIKSVFDSIKGKNIKGEGDDVIGPDDPGAESEI